MHDVVPMQSKPVEAVSLKFNSSYAFYYIRPSPSEVDNMEANTTISECPPIDQLIKSSQALDNEEPLDVDHHFKWFPYSEFTDICLCQNSTKQTIYYAKCMREDKETVVMLLLLGTRKECTQEFIQEFA